MAVDADAQIIREFVRDISARLDEAANIARTVQSLGNEGLTERVFQSLLEIEPLIDEASVLLNASSIVRRRDHLRDETS